MTLADGGSGHQWRTRKDDKEWKKNSLLSPRATVLQLDRLFKVSSVTLYKAAGPPWSGQMHIVGNDDACFLIYPEFPSIA